jgi:serine/threonine protein kinase
VGRAATFEFSGTDRFVIRRRLGAGGMGVVYEALDREQNTPIALKTLRRIDGQTLYRLKNEFRALQDLQHPNLCRLGELHEAGGQWFFTMELIEGVSFIRYVRPNVVETASPTAPTLSEVTPDADTLASDAAGATVDDARTRSGAGAAAAQSTTTAHQFDDQRLRAALGQLASGLAALHDAGKVHRDIKPSNILCTATGRVVLLDFGLITDAWATGTPTEAHAVGTPEYMAPEQAAAKPVDPAADWYSVGMILYEALTGRLPFSGSALQIFMAKQEHEPPPPRVYVPDLPADLDALCTELCRFDPDLRPSWRKIRARLGLDEPSRRRAPSNSSHHTAGTPFVGRAPELGVLAHAFAAMLRGHAQTVLVHGESGVGKSALIRAFTQRIDAPGAVTLAGRCYERETVPYKAVDGVIDALAQHMRRLPKTQAAMLLPRHAALLPKVFPVLGRVEVIAQTPALAQASRDPHELRGRVFLALRELLFLLAERHPLVLVIDDLQWADADSLLLLGELMRPPEAPPLLLLCSLRSDAGIDDADDGDGADAAPPADSNLAAGADANGGPAALTPIPGEVRHIRLRPLAGDAALELTRLLLERAGLSDTIDAATLAAEARGHPLYIDELVRHAELGGDAASHRLRLDEAIWARASQLEPGAVRVLELAAVAGAPLSQAILCDAAELERGEFARHLSLLRVANLVRGGRGPQSSVEPYHDRVREAVLSNLEDASRRQRHQRLAVALESADAQRDRPELLLRHLEAAGQNERAAHYAGEAGDRAAAALAFGRAAELYRAALRLRSHDDATLRELRRRLGDALANAGHGAESAHVYLQVAEGAEPVLRLDYQQKAAAQFLFSGHIEPGIETITRVLGHMGVRFPRSPRRALLSLLWHRARIRARGIRWTERHESDVAAHRLTQIDAFGSVATGLGIVDPVRSSDFQARGLLLALKTGERRRITRAILNEAAYSAIGGGRGMARAQRLLERARPLVEGSGDPYLRALAITVKGMVTYFGGRFMAACALMKESEALFRDETTGTWGELNVTRSFQVFALRDTGRIKLLRQHIDTYVRDAEQRGDRYSVTTFRRNGNIVWIAHDDPDKARRDLARAGWVPPEGSYHLQHFFELLATAELQLLEGNTADALDSVRPGFRALGRSLLGNTIQMMRAESRSLWGRLALAQAGAVADPRPALREARAIVRKLERERVGFAKVWAALLDAGIAAHTRPERAVVRLRDAIAHAQENDMILHAACARRRLGELLGGEEGALLLAAADEWMGEQEIVNPPAMCRVVTPGFGSPAR